MLDFVGKERYSYNDLVELMAILRRECPWDREQTHASIRMNFIEETYEAVEAIDTGDAPLLCEELGDVMLQVVFHSQIERERGTFSMDDVVDGVCRKLVHRHPHIFSDTKASDADTVLANWERIKRDDKGGGHTAAVEGVAASLPALMRADKILARAARAGFAFRHTEEVWRDVEEELSECRAAIGGGSAAEEIGDVLFAVCNLARFLNVNPEQALDGANKRFSRRFAYLERRAQDEGGMDSISFERMQDLWDEAKDEGL